MAREPTPRKNGETMRQTNTELETCYAIDRPDRILRLESYGSLLPVQIPPTEIVRVQSFLNGREHKSPSLSSNRKERMLALSDGKKCPTCQTVMSYYRGTKFGHEIPDAATIEHVIPKCLGGSNENKNLTVRCNLCNRASGHSMNEWLQANRQNSSWEEIRMIMLYLCLEVFDITKAETLYPDLFRSFITKRISLEVHKEEVIS